MKSIHKLLTHSGSKFNVGQREHKHWEQSIKQPQKYDSYKSSCLQTTTNTTINGS